MPDNATTELGEFFDYFWHETPGFVYLPYHMEPYGLKDWKSVMFRWPNSRAGAIRHVLKHAATTSNVFFAPGLFSKASPKKDAVLGTWNLWVDFDGNAPEDWSVFDIPKPTLRVQSSLESHQHAYWQLDEFLTDVSVIEDRNRAIAYTLKADTSGWDADQILRPIHTVNRKRNLPVIVKEWQR